MKLFKAYFVPVYNVLSGLIILAENLQAAADIASETIMHVKTFSLEEVLMDKPCVVLYQSGDY